MQNSLICVWLYHYTDKINTKYQRRENNLNQQQSSLFSSVGPISKKVTTIIFVNTKWVFEDITSNCHHIDD